jgi:hypothetical protein
MNRVDHSEECSKSELDLFTVPPTQVAVEEGIWDDIKPHPNFKTGTVTFDITGDSTNYISLADTELWLKLKIEVKKNNEWKPIDWTTKPNIGPVNNLIHSLFSQCQVYLNNKEVEIQIMHTRPTLTIFFVMVEKQKKRFSKAKCSLKMKLGRWMSMDCMRNHQERE